MPMKPINSTEPNTNMNQNASTSSPGNSNVASNQQSSDSSATPRTLEISVTAPKDPDLSVQLMNFPKSLNFDLAKVKKAQIKRDLAATESAAAKEEQPKFGAGSRYGGPNKFTPKQKMAMPKSEPYTLKTKSQDGAFKKFKSRHERGETESSTYYVLVRGPNGFQALPLEEWHSFQSVPLKNITTATSEEVENIFKQPHHQRYGFENKLKYFNRGHNENGQNEKCEIEKSHRSSSEFSSDDESDREVLKQRTKSNKWQQNLDDTDDVADDSDNGDGLGDEVDYFGGNSDVESESELLYVESLDEDTEMENGLNSNDESPAINAGEKGSEKETPMQTVSRGRKRKAKDENVAEKSTKKIKKPINSTEPNTNMNQNASTSSPGNSNVASNQQSSDSSATPRTLEISVTAPKDPDLSVQLMNFPKSLNFDLAKVKKAQIKRDLAATESAAAKVEQPKFGAGSRYGGPNKFTPKQKMAMPKSEPYTLKTKSQDGAFKKFKSRHERGETESSTYYVLVRGPNGFQALPLEEWHSFQSVPLKNITTATSEEVENIFKQPHHQRYGFENKLKYFNRGHNENGQDEKCEIEKSHRSSSEFSSDDESDREDVKRQKRTKSNKWQQNSDDADDVADDSDNGDRLGDEVDYFGGNSDVESESELLYVESLDEDTEMENGLNSNDESPAINEGEKGSETETPVQTVSRGRKRKAKDENVAEKSTKKIKKRHWQERNV